MGLAEEDGVFGKVPVWMKGKGPENSTGDELESWFEGHVKRPTEAIYQRYFVELILRQRPLPPSMDGRHIPLDCSNEHHLIDERRGHAYLNNSIRSSRYTVWDFLPKQFAFQATRLHNFYFICIGVPQAIPGLSTTGNYTTILPLTFFILLTVVKEAYDDYCRHRMDKVENSQSATVLRPRGAHEHGLASQLHSWRVGLDKLPWPRKASQRSPGQVLIEDDVDEELKWARIPWHSITVGDVVKLRRDDAVPADIALLSASGESGVAYIETMALDGETNLKSKQAPHALQKCCANMASIRSVSAAVVSEDPNRDLYDYNGRVTIADKSIPLTLNEVVFRGSVLRNTKYAIGLVLNTGEECKIRMNANHHPKAKKPRLERYANQVVLTLIIYVVLLSIGVSMGYLIWHANFEVNAWYLNNAYVSFKEIIVGFLIMFNNVIPLALYVSLEIVKIGQMIMIQSDEHMYDAESDRKMVCNTNTILENLGQVSYILSDKTGTLTENVMRFRGMSIGGIAFTHGDVPAEEEQGNSAGRMSVVGRASIGSEQQVVGGAERSGNGKVSFTVESIELSSLEGSPSRPTGRPSLQQRQSSGAFSRGSKQVSNDAFTTTKLLEYMHDHPMAPISQKAHSFLLAMAICHTALPETGSDGSTTFQASSPDELALLQAAQDLGYLLIQRSTQSITLLQTSSTGTQNRHVYEILDVIEFSSKRKRMSIVVRCPDGRIWLLCKGADSAIMSRLRQAELASRKSHEVRRSVQAERELVRRSIEMEARNSFGNRPSMSIVRGTSMDIRPIAHSAGGKRSLTLEVPRGKDGVRVQTQSLDVPRMTNGSRVHTTSLDVPGRSSHTTSNVLSSPDIIDDATVFTRCFKQIDDFAAQGLRTLLFAHKFIPAADYSTWKRGYQEASTSLINRQQRIEAAAELVEHGFELLGASAIEDKLQEGVPETIEKLRRANIKIWMLTGDKRETAINIAHSARICKPESEIFVLDSQKSDLEAQLNEAAMDIRTGCLHSVLVIDGHTLSEVDADTSLKQTFYALIPLVASVICCRASPAQKASIVLAIRHRLPSALTLAIGDGANDIAMIQSSHVGVGISGKEGLQAARVADYSISQFRFLQRLLLVHGRWNYIRTARFILATFWKEMFFYMMQALYTRPAGYTGTSLYENWSLTVLNTLFTSLCTIVPGIFEQDLKAETLLAVPELYVFGQRNKGLNMPDYAWWMLLATAQGMVVWFVAWAGFGQGARMSDNGLFALGDLCFTLGICWTNVKLLVLETHYKTRIVAVSFCVTVGGWFAWNGFMSGVYSDNLSPYDVKGGFSSTFGNDPAWWATLVLALAILAVVDIGYKSARIWARTEGLWPLWKAVGLGLGGRRARIVNAEEVDVGVWQGLEKEGAVGHEHESRGRRGYEDDGLDE
ncbi:hypothetical protein LTR62_006291 [Meristemomyces frigidus]|uniref:Phospholipid-transporting ATPase n=1 Tax=Meristemomyces frigidus TaxID=1508187 RepID=A0AAN7TCH3_9PEZI|nr:hypothetical protein LTR62_006291 [Meristemomyces frigidus]